MVIRYACDVPESWDRYFGHAVQHLAFPAASLTASSDDDFRWLTPLYLAQACGHDLRVHFKNTREAAFRIANMDLSKAKRFLEDVIAHKRCVPFLRYNGGVGRTSQAANEGRKSQSLWR